MGGRPPIETAGPPKGKFGEAKPPPISNGGGGVHPRGPTGVAVTTPDALKGGRSHPKMKQGWCGHPLYLFILTLK